MEEKKQAPRIEPYRLLALGLLAAVLLSGAGFLFYRQSQGSPPLEILLPTATPPPSKEIKVYVTGAVQQPGVYPLKVGDRVEEAIRAAGGPLPEADLNGINLAARVRDEEHLRVPRLGEPKASAFGASGKLNINSASAVLLETLPGIGPTYAKRIVDYRTQKGPFQRLEELRDLKLVPAFTYEGIKDLITVE